MANVAEIIKDHVTLAVESFDRLYLNGYVPRLQTSGGLVDFLVKHRKNPIPSPALLQRITQDFVREVEALIQRDQLPVVPFKRRDRKDDVANEVRRKHPKRDGVVFVGVAQEKAFAFKAAKRSAGNRVGFDYSRQEVFVKHFYFYLDDEDFGPAFIKICTYFPFPIRVCINGHEWVKRQLEKKGIAYEGLDNGFLSCTNPQALQETALTLGPEQIDRFFRKWISRLPFPLNAQDLAAGYQHQLSIWQAEFSLTQVFDRPVRGREFFEEVIRENIDLGRPERVQLLFDRKIIKSTPGLFRTRLITSGVYPSIHIQYKSTDIKQYFKENRALRTETTIKDPTDFGVGKKLDNLLYLKKIASNTNHRLLDTEKVTQNCVLSYESVQRLTQPSVTKDGQRAPAMKLGDTRVMALFAALTLFLHLPNGFRNSDLRRYVADLMGLPHAAYTTSKMTYDLRRLRLKGIIAPIRGTHRYFLTLYGCRASLFFTRLHSRVLRPGFAAIDPDIGAQIPHSLRQALERVDKEVQSIVDASGLREAG